MPTKHMIHLHIPVHRKNGKAVDMTQGNITKHLISFALPLLIGNIFQQMYNMVDTWVVGNYVSNEAYSAVGSVGPIINMLIGTFTGLSSGAGVVISQYFGARRYDDVHDTVHTSALLTLILSVVFTAAGLLMIPFMLRLMNTPTVVLPESTTYLTIYFSGLVGLLVYNMGAAILRAIGDSKRPFYYLVVCAVMNTVLDLVFVLVFHRGVDGVAWATILSQGISAILVTVTLLKTSTCVKLKLPDLRLHWHLLRKIFAVGIPAALQMAITAFSNVFVQSYINFFGPDCMSGWTTYSKVDQLLFLPMQSISLAATTFVGQNLGSGLNDRARQGVRQSVLIAVISTVVLTVPVIIFARPIVAFFNDKAEVIDNATMLLCWITPFYVFCCFNQVYTGALRGAGNGRAPMIIMLASFVVFRQIYLFMMSRVWNEIIPIGMSYPAGWLVCSIATIIYYHKVQLGKNSLVENAPPQSRSANT